MQFNDTNTKSDKTLKANLIIHGFATAAATCSAVTSFVPFLGPLMGDTVGLTMTTIAMTVSLANLFGKKFEEGALAAFGSVVAGMIFGVGLAKGFASLIPGGGSLINATVTFTLHETIGWGLFLLFERGGNLPTSRSELDKVIKIGEVEAPKRKGEYEEIMNKLPPDVREQVEQLQKKLAKNLSQAEKVAISDQIAILVKKYQ